MDTLNTIKARHFSIVDGMITVNPQDYFWHIPKNLRSENIKKGDVVLVSATGQEKKVVVVDVLRENFKLTGKKYKPVLAKLNDAENIKIPLE